MAGGRRRGLLDEERKITVGTGFYIEGDRREIPWQEGGGEVSLVKKGRSLLGTGFYIEGDRREIPLQEGGGEVSLVKKGRSLWGLGSI